MHGLALLYTVLTVLWVLGLTTLLPIVSRRRLENFKLSPIYTKQIEIYKFNRGLCVGLTVLLLLLSLLFHRELGYRTTLLLTAGLSTMCNALIWLSFNFTDLRDDYLDGLQAALTDREVIGWWCGKGQARYIHRTWKADEKVDFPRLKGFLFFSGKSVRNTEAGGRDGRMIRTKIVFRALGFAKTTEFRTHVSQAEAVIKGAMQRLLDTGKDRHKIRQHLQMLEQGAMGDVSVQFSRQDTHLYAEEPVFIEAD